MTTVKNVADNKFFAIHFICFGEIEEQRFSTYAQMQAFTRQLRPGALLRCGCTDDAKQSAKAKEAA